MPGLEFTADEALKQVVRGSVLAGGFRQLVFMVVE